MSTLGYAKVISTPFRRIVKYHQETSYIKNHLNIKRADKKLYRLQNQPARQQNLLINDSFQKHFPRPCLHLNYSLVPQLTRLLLDNTTAFSSSASPSSPGRGKRSEEREMKSGPLIKMKRILLKKNGIFRLRLFISSFVASFIYIITCIMASIIKAWRAN